MMTLKHGSFYQYGVKVPIEFGNKHQIHLLQKAEALVDGVLASIMENEDAVSIGYTCLCGNRFFRHYSYANWNDLQHDKFTCEGCGLKYTLDGESHNPSVVVKLDSKQNLK